MNKLNKILNYIYTPLIKMVNKNNNEPTVNIEDRSFFQILIMLFYISKVLLLITVSLITRHQFAIYVDIMGLKIPMHLIYIILYQIIVDSYFSFGFAYYYHITLKNFLKFIGRQFLDLTLSSIATFLIFTFGYHGLKYTESTVLSRILGLLIFGSGMIFGLYRIIMIFIYHQYVTYSKYYLNKYSEEHYI